MGRGKGVSGGQSLVFHLGNSREDFQVADSLLWAVGSRNQWEIHEAITRDAALWLLAARASAMENKPQPLFPIKLHSLTCPVSGNSSDP